MDIDFKGPGRMWRSSLLRDLLDETVILDTDSIAWVLFTDSMKKGMNKGCQTFLKNELDKKRVSRIPAAALPGFEFWRRFVYYLPKRKPGRDEAGHRLLLNLGIVPLKLIERVGFPFKEISCDAEYNSIPTNGMPTPVTSITLASGKKFIPDATIFGTLADDSTALFFLEADNGSEPLLSYDQASDTGFAKHSLLHKITRYEQYLDEFKQGLVSEDELAPGAIQVLFLFSQEKRMHRFRLKTLHQFERELPHVWMTTRNQIVDPRRFWTDKIWFRLMEHGQPSALLKGQQLALNPIEKGTNCE